MRKALPQLIMTVGLTLGAAGSIYAAPVAGSADYVTLYNTVFSDCTLPDGTVAACEAAINAYAGRLVGDGVEIADANASFMALRSEVFAANAADDEFQALIDALFEELLPDSGSIGAPAGGEPAQTLNPGSGTPVTASPS